MSSLHRARFVAALCLLGLLLWLVVMALTAPKAHAAEAPYQSYKIAYGCLYVVTGGAGGGVAAVVAPSVQGKCQ
jgi:hypothetical protein